MQGGKYTIGELAKLAKVSVKAVRVYERKGLILPERDENNDYRYFNEEDVVTLQRIQMLRYLGFGLDSIGEMLKQYDAMSLTESFREQKRLLKKKANELDRMIYCMDRAINESQSETFRMSSLFDALHKIITSRRADEALARMRGHSNEPVGWSRWVFEHARLSCGDRILDAGCGWGNLWRCNADRYPKNMQVTLVDFHNSHADELAKFVTDKQQFEFLWGDLNELDFQKKYDCIFFNHVVFYMKDPIATYQKLSDCLSERGKMIATWGGFKLYEELSEMLSNYCPQDGKSVLTEAERIKTNLAKHEKELREVFGNVTQYKYPLVLRFDTVGELAEFLEPFAMKLGVNPEGDMIRFAGYLEERFAGEPYEIGRDTYLYVCMR